MHGSIRAGVFRHLKMLALTGLLVLGACGGGDDVTAPAAPAVRALEVSPVAPSVAAGTSVQLAATALYTDNSHRDVTSQVAWTSDAPAVATVDAAGHVSGVAAGSTSVSASFEGQTGSATLTVTPATVVRIAVTAALSEVAAGGTVRYQATGTLTDSTTQDLTADMNWSSSAPAVAGIDASGLATSLAQGRATISANCPPALGCAQAQASATLDVSAATLSSIALTPERPSLSLGTSVQLVATGTYSDRSVRNVSTEASWTSGAPTVASVGTTANTIGRVTTHAIGSAQITAAIGAVSATPIMLDVTAATLTSIAVAPGNPSVAAGRPQQFSASGSYTDQTTQDLTSQVVWASSNAAVATISNAAGAHGFASALVAGVTSITAAMGSVSSSPTAFNVTAATLTSLAVTPASTFINAGATAQYTALGGYSDGSTQDVTAGVTWTSNTTSVATISNASGSRGLATGVSNGVSTVSALLDGRVAVASLGVQPSAFATPGAHVWTVPAGATSVQIVATGGGGGGGAFAGGYGGRVTANLTVASGDTLNIFVGGGGSADSTTGGGGGATTVLVGSVIPIIAGGGGGSGGGDGGDGNGGDGGGSGTASGVKGAHASGGLGGNAGVGGGAGPSGFGGVAGADGSGGPGGSGGTGPSGGIGLGTGAGGAGGSSCCGGGGGGGFGGGGGAGSGPGQDGGGGGGGSTGPAGAVYSVGTNRGAAGLAGTSGSVVITILP